jgi:hypothetical protein
MPTHKLKLQSMYYHAAVLLLFRPFLKAKFTESDLTPSEICRQAAASISDLFSEHRSLYDTVGIYTFQLHCLLTACTIHIINIPAIASTTYLTQACNHFHDLARWNEWATGSLTIIKGLVRKWSIILPGEAELALYRTQRGDELHVGSGVTERDGGPRAEMFRSPKRMAFLNPPAQDSLQKRQKLDSQNSSHPQKLPGTASLISGHQQIDGRLIAAGQAPGLQPSSHTAQDKPRPEREQQTNYLFAPFPNQPAPLLGPIHTSIGVALNLANETSNEAPDFDGISFEGGGGWFDPFMGYQGEI